MDSPEIIQVPKKEESLILQKMLAMGYSPQ